VNSYLENKEYSRKTMEMDYKRVWTKQFQKRLRMGRFLQTLMLHTNWFDFTLSTLASSRTMLTGVISSTHGKPILQ
ncbi:MAG: FAD-dependent oxidoreductase, partial [Bacteroidota bacterium]